MYFSVAEIVLHLLSRFGRFGYNMIFPWFMQLVTLPDEPYLM